MQKQSRKKNSVQYWAWLRSDQRFAAGAHLCAFPLPPASSQKRHRPRAHVRACRIFDLRQHQFENYSARSRRLVAFSFVFWVDWLLDLFVGRLGRLFGSGERSGSRIVVERNGVESSVIIECMLHRSWYQLLSL